MRTANNADADANANQQLAVSKQSASITIG
jgi:hypothetical protein